MTVKELIKKLQDIPDDLKDCEIGMHQYETIFTDVASIDKLNIYVSDGHQSVEKSIKEAKEAEEYKFFVLM